jgi:leucyl aminopeptidase
MDFKIAIVLSDNEQVKKNTWQLVDLMTIHYICSKSINQDNSDINIKECIRREATDIYKFISNLNTGYHDKSKIKNITIDNSLLDGNSFEGNILIPFLEGLHLCNYEFNHHKTNQKSNTFNIITESNYPHLEAVVFGTHLARDLVNHPLSYLTALQLSDEIKRVGAETGFKVEVLDESAIRDLKMGGVLSVNKGSVAPPTFNILTYRHPDLNKDQAPDVLVGKGVVYDTGGLSLKPTANSMDMMKCDMGGAATVIGAIAALAKAKSMAYVIGLIPAVENRPGGEAYVPGDIITMMDGTTVEVLNTDAEGRLILADALHYAKRYNPSMVIDVATLTGSAARSVGKYGIVAMGNINNDYMLKLSDIGNQVGERVAWQPFWSDYATELKSFVADIKNIGSAEAGHITAGKFLEHFTDYPWFHLDIAGSAFLKSSFLYHPEGGTGIGVRLLFQFFDTDLNRLRRKSL